MNERKYMEDWALESRIDEKTGKEKRVPVYRGTWYQFGSDAPGKKERTLASLLPCLAFLALILLYFSFNFPGATTLYVFLPAALSLFPGVYWLMGACTVWGIPEKKMTRLQKENGVGRVLRSALGCALFACISVLSDAVYMIANGCVAQEAPGLLLLAAAACIAYAVMRRFNRINGKITEWKELDP